MDFTDQAIEALRPLAYHEPKTLDGQARPFAIIEEPSLDSHNCGLSVVDMEQYLDRPVRKRASNVAIDQTSFCEYVARHATPGSTELFASLGKTVIVAIIDYHEAGGSGKAGWKEHTATLDLTLTKEWEKWTKGEGKHMSQVEFAEFLEDLAHTVVIPDAASIIDIALNLQANVDVRFDSKINRFTGGSQLYYTEDVNNGSKGQIKVPESMKVTVPPFRFSKPVDILVRLRVRIREGKAVFFYQLDRIDRILEEAFIDVAKDVAATTGISPLIVQ